MHAESIVLLQHLLDFNRPQRQTELQKKVSEGYITVTIVVSMIPVAQKIGCLGMWIDVYV